MVDDISKNTVSIDVFASLDVRVGLVTHAEPVVGSKKLIKLTVDFGEPIGTRTILTGLLLYYPDMATFIQKKYIFLTNLAPRVMAGQESCGMLLTCDGGVGMAPTLIEVAQAQPGDTVR